MSETHSTNRDRRPLCQSGGAVALSVLATSVAVFLCGGCDGRRETVFVQPVSDMHWTETQPIGQPPQSPPPAARPAQSEAASVVEQPEAQKPKISFVGPRPPQFPFRMELMAPPDPPAVLELSPFAPGEAVQDRLRRILRSEIARYPAGTLDGVVDKVIIGSTLTYNGHAAGGSYIVSIVFIAAGEQDAGAATDAHVVRTFHHEVSSILLLWPPGRFDEAKFRAALPEGFVYRDDRQRAAPDAPFGPADNIPSLELIDEGFLIPWAKWNMEQDFNSYAEVLMRKPGLLLKTFAPESRVGRKARVVCDFYIAIDPRFEAMLDPDGK